MRDFDDTTLWRNSEFERIRLQTGGSGFARLDEASVLPSTILADLRRLEPLGAADDALEVVASCMRHRESALLCVQCDGLVWPLTLFPLQTLCHSPGDLTRVDAAAMARLKLLGVEPPGMRAPGIGVRTPRADMYHPLEPLLWALALRGPRADLLLELAGPCAYRALRNPAAEGSGVSLGGAIGSAAQRLRRETVSLRTIAGWPGMSVERACRLVNGLYLSSALLASRSHPAARPEPKWFRRSVSR